MSHPAFDLKSLAILGDLRRRREANEKAAFTPSPAVAQLAMQAGAGGDPSGGGGAPPGMPPGGPGGPPPGDPSAGGAPPGAPPGPPMDPTMAAAPPGGDPSGGATPGGPGGAQDPISMLAQGQQQILQLLQQQQSGGGGGGGASGPGGKPTAASIKFEPAHMHQIMHDLSNMKNVVAQMADAMGIQVPAATLLNQPAPAPSSTSMPGGSPGGAASSAPPAPGGPPAGAPLAVSLPSLPPAVAKAGQDSRLSSGRAVPKIPAPPSSGSTFSAVASILAKKKVS